MLIILLKEVFVITYIDKKKFNIYYEVSDIRIKSPLFEVDEFLAPIISIFNKKGYRTEYCCSGHLTNVDFGEFSTPNADCYIMFKKHYSILDSLPDGFTTEINTNRSNKAVTIRKYYTQENRFYEIMDTMKELYEWANSVVDN